MYEWFAGEKASKAHNTPAPHLQVVPFSGFQGSVQPLLTQPQPLASRSTAAVNRPVAAAVALPAGCPALALPVVPHQKLLSAHGAHYASFHAGQDVRQ